MKIRVLPIGTKVRFLDEKGEGVISGYTSDGYALVMMKDGFEIPYLPNKLVTTEKVNQVEIAELPKESQGPSLIESYYIAIALEGMKGDVPELSIQMLNTCKEPVQAIVYSQNAKTLSLELNQLVPAKSATPMGKTTLQELLTKDRFHVLIIPVPNATLSMALGRKGVVRHQVPQLINPAVWPTHAALSKRGLLFEIQVEGEKKTPLNPIKAPDPAPEFLIKEAQKGVFEVDLHIEELLDNTMGMSNTEIIQMQLNHFHKSVDEAKVRKIKRLILIHGIGKGVLKTEIHKQLDKEGIAYFDAPLARYGYGATEIRLVF